MTPRIFIMLILLCCGFHLPARETGEGQSSQIKGFTFDLGLGVGNANRVCALCYDQKNLFGTTFSTNIAFRFNERWKSGVGVFLWAESGQIFLNDSPANEDPNNTRLSLYLNGSYSPFKDKNFFLTAGAGAGNFFFTPNRALPLDDGSFSRSSVIDVGLAFTVGTGYEWKIGKKIYLVPSLNYHHTFLGDFEVYPGTIRNSNPSGILTFQLNLLFRSKN